MADPTPPLTSPTLLRVLDALELFQVRDGDGVSRWLNSSEFRQLCSDTANDRKLPRVRSFLNHPQFRQVCNSLRGTRTGYAISALWDPSLIEFCHNWATTFAASLPSTPRPKKSTPSIAALKTRFRAHEILARLAAPRILGQTFEHMSAQIATNQAPVQQPIQQPVQEPAQQPVQQLFQQPVQQPILPAQRAQHESSPRLVDVLSPAAPVASEIERPAEFEPMSIEDAPMEAEASLRRASPLASPYQHPTSSPPTKASSQASPPASQTSRPFYFVTLSQRPLRIRALKPSTFRYEATQEERDAEFRQESENSTRNGRPT